MNIYTQFCGLIIVTLILFFYHRQPTLGMKTEYRFLNLLYAVAISVSLDIFSCIVISHPSNFNQYIIEYVSRFYLCSLTVVSYCSILYSITGVYEKMPIHKHKLKKIIYRPIFVLVNFLILYLPIEVHYDGVALYTSGPACIVTYAGVLFFILTIVGEVLTHKKHINRKRMNALFVWLSIWVITAIIQFCFPKLLIVGFATCLGMLILFCEIENPEGAISRKTGHFSSSVVSEYFDYLYYNKKNFSILMISFAIIADSTHDSLILRKTISSLSEYLFSLKDVKVFDTAEGYFILVFDSPNFLESTKFQITNYFNSLENSSDATSAVSLLNPVFTMVPNSNVATNAYELLSVLTSFVPTEYKNLIANEIVIDEKNMANVRDRKKIEDMVVDAIANNRVEVFYQPIYSVKKDLFTSAEALVRIRLKDGTLVQPGSFIPVVEQIGRIIPLSNVVYHQVLSFIKAFRIERLKLEYIELNLSVKQGESTSFAGIFQEMLAEHDVSPDKINLEITETSSLVSKENILANMRELEKIGCNFSLDDFGSGSSNLNYIIDMPVKYVKVDRELTSAYFENEKAASIIKAVIEMAHSIGIEIIAEGIETEEALETMKALGVDYIQGYYFSPPIPERDFIAFIQKKNLK